MVTTALGWTNLSTLVSFANLIHLSALRFKSYIKDYWNDRSLQHCRVKSLQQNHWVEVTIQLSKEEDYQTSKIRPYMIWNFFSNRIIRRSQEIPFGVWPVLLHQA